jgi:hypothetical protein
MPTDSSDSAPPRRLDTIFLTGPGGLVYEFPRALAEQHLVTQERLWELGHLPIVPYGARVLTAPRDDGDEVGGRHMAVEPSGAIAYHSDVRFGVYRWSDGYYYQGEHFHPYGDETGHPV